MQTLCHKVIYQNRGEYAAFNSFPSAVITQSGRMLVAFRQARDFSATRGKTVHLDPKSRAVLLASEDGGASWVASSLADHFLYGVQDPCLTLLADGTVAGTYFLWKVVEPNGERGDTAAYGEWIGRLMGVQTVRSQDEGRTWDEPLPLGPLPLALRGNLVELADGTLLAAPYRGNEVHLFASQDRGQSWERRYNFVHPDYSLNETNLYQTPSGKVVAFVRSRQHRLSVEPPSPLLTAESTDGGQTWSPLRVRAEIESPTPFHLLRLQSGRVLLSYGYRREPYGIRAHLLDAECEQWGEAVELRSGGPDRDIGYTSAVQQADGTIWVFHYWHDPGSGGHRHIAATLCRE